MDEYFNCIKNYIIRSIYTISIFNCETINMTDKELNNKIDDLVKYIIKDWRE